MAGRDASANLGGMLSQIGGAFGAAGQSVGQGLMRPITMAFRPTVNMADPESLRKQAAFYGRVGDTEQQRMFSTQAETVAEKQQVEAQRTGQAAVADIQRQMQETLGNKALTPEQKSAALMDLQNKANAAAQTYKLNPLQTATLASDIERDFNNRLLQEGQLTDRLTQQARTEAQATGQGVIAGLRRQMSETLSNPALTSEQQRNRLAALQVQVDDAAVKYQLPATQYMALSENVQQSYTQQESNQLSLQVARNTNQRTLALKALEAAYAKNATDPDAYQAARVEIQKTHPGLVRQFDRAEEKYKADKEAAERAAAGTGEFSEEEKTYYGSLGMSDEAIAAANKLGLRKSFRAQMSNLAIARAAEERAAARGSAIEYGVIQDVIPSVVKEIRDREGSGKDAGWFWFDAGAAEVINDLLEEQDGTGLKELSARVKASGARTIEEVKKVVLMELERNEPGSLGSLLASNPDYDALFTPTTPPASATDKKDDDDKQDGTTTVTLPNGQTATIKQKSS